MTGFVTISLALLLAHPVSADFFASHSWERTKLAGGKCGDVLDCHNHGMCVDRFIGVMGSCKCHKGWVGEHCAEKQNDTLDEPPATSADEGDKRNEGGHCKAHKDCNSPKGFCVRGKCECLGKAAPPYCGAVHASMRGAARRKSSPERTWCESSASCQNGGTCSSAGRCGCLAGFSGPWCNDADDSSGDSAAAASSPAHDDIHDQLGMLKAKLQLLQLQKSLAAMQEGNG